MSPSNNFCRRPSCHISIVHNFSETFQGFLRTHNQDAFIRNEREWIKAIKTFWIFSHSKSWMSRAWSYENEGNAFLSSGFDGLYHRHYFCLPLLYLGLGWILAVVGKLMNQIRLFLCVFQETRFPWNLWNSIFDHKLDFFNPKLDWGSWKTPLFRTFYWVVFFHTRNRN